MLPVPTSVRRFWQDIFAKAFADLFKRGGLAVLIADGIHLLQRAICYSTVALFFSII